MPAHSRHGMSKPLPPSVRLQRRHKQGAGHTEEDGHRWNGAQCRVLATGTQGRNEGDEVGHRRRFLGRGGCVREEERQQAIRADGIERRAAIERVPPWAEKYQQTKGEELVEQEYHEPVRRNRI